MNDNVDELRRDDERREAYLQRSREALRRARDAFHAGELTITDDGILIIGPNVPMWGTPPAGESSDQGVK